MDRMGIAIEPGDEVLARFGNSLAILGDERANRVLARGLNHEGDKARTQHVRALVQATGLKYRDIKAAMRTIRAGPNNLAYTLEFVGGETNLGVYGARQTKRGVSAAPWKTRRVFPGTFIIKAFGGKVYKRAGKSSDDTRYKLMDYGIKGSGRFPLRPIYGPNLAREAVKGIPAKTWLVDQQRLGDRIAHEIEREMVADTIGLPMGNYAGS